MPPPVVFVLLHSFSGCHGHCLQGEKLTAAFCHLLTSHPLKQQCSPASSLCLILFIFFARLPEAQRADSRRRNPATSAHLEDAAAVAAAAAAASAGMMMDLMRGSISAPVGLVSSG